MLKWQNGQISVKQLFLSYDLANHIAQNANEEFKNLFSLSNTGRTESLANSKRTLQLPIHGSVVRTSYSLTRSVSYISVMVALSYTQRKVVL